MNREAGSMKKRKKITFPRVEIECPEEVFQQWLRYWIFLFSPPRDRRERELLAAFKTLSKFME